ncbi:MAG TPA: S1 RNA-binding domain-containing protein, partial [Candidatus Kapabacteria bacterium]|nr:S1 RNA-binding domain-containing protein [Candidatus Kapabacteria bacterium]
IGGVEGLIHISRLSQIRTEDPTKLFKRGDTIRAVVVELDKERGRIGLSRKETEESPWTNIEQEFPIGSIHSAKIRRFTDFGAYLELRSGIDGLLRTGEMSWTKRIRKPSELFKVGDSLDVSILSISEEKRAISLSLKRTQPNPWKEIAEKYAVGKEFEGKVSFIMQKGAIVTINDELDGFMPRSKMKNIGSGNRIPYQTGDVISVTIADIVPDEESLILAPVNDKAASATSYNNQDRNQKRNNKPTNTIPQSDKAKGNESGTFTFGDMLSEQMKDTLQIQP